MKKYLFSIIILITLFVAGPLYAASTYYGGASSQAINSDSLWFTAVDSSCTGHSGNGVTWATASANGNKLIANGCTITIPNTSTQTLPATGQITISNKSDGGSNVVDGGQFTYVTSSTYAVTLSANVEAGGTTGACLSISGSGNTNPVFTLLASTITGGSATNVHGYTSTHTVGTVVIGSNGSPVTITGGTAGNVYGVYPASNAPTTLYGNATASTGAGVANGSSSGVITMTGNCTSVGSVNGCTMPGAGPINLTGDCTGNDTGAGAGCAGSTTGTFTIVGNIKDGTKGPGKNAYAVWNPGAANYYKAQGPTAGNYQYFGPASQTAAKIYAGETTIKVSDGSQITGTLRASNIATAYGSGDNLSAGILQTGKTVDGIAGSLSSGGGGTWGF